MNLFLISLILYSNEMLQMIELYQIISGKSASCDGRVVKAFDSKSNGIFPRRFESYSQRLLVSHWVDLENFTKTCALSGNRTPVSRVAGENSTTEPTMLAIWSKSHLGNDMT